VSRRLPGRSAQHVLRGSAEAQNSYLGDFLPPEYGTEKRAFSVNQLDATLTQL
jgi:hypothetical protein